MKLTVGMAKSQFGNPEPEVRVELPKGTSWRTTRAALFRLAADIEDATPRREGWIAQIDERGDDVGRVYLELATGGHGDEAERGLAVLDMVAARQVRSEEG